MGNIHKTFSGIIDRDKKSVWLFPLYLISIIYSGIVHVRNILYDHDILTKKKVGVTVISVGNITLGGTGKTPTVIMLARLLKERGYSPAIVSRGYGGESRDSVNVVSDGNKVLMKPRDAGDEPVLIARSLPDIPVITGKNRYVAAKNALARFDIDLFILDDAFQHRPLFRDIDILLLDAKRPFGNGLLIPGGRLRESIGSVKRTDIIVETGTEGEGDSSLPDMIAEGFPAKPIFTGYRKPKDIMRGHSGEIFFVDYLRGKKIYAFSGIANPDNFSKTITSLGGIITETLIFPDHHVYNREDIARITEGASSSEAELILTTEKDHMKLIDFNDFLRDIFILRITMEVAPSGKFEECLLEKLASH